jgi:hypothetical protein
VGDSQPFHHVKIDLNGKEHFILRRRVKLLASYVVPLIHPGRVEQAQSTENKKLLQAHCYAMTEKRYTR